MPVVVYCKNTTKVVCRVRGDVLYHRLFVDLVLPDNVTRRKIRPKYPEYYSEHRSEVEVDTEDVKTMFEEKYGFVNDEKSRRFRVAEDVGSAQENFEDMAFRSFAARRIVGGMETSISVYPYNVAISKAGKHWCGGSVIDEQWVLTAGHCMESAHDGQKFKLRTFIVRAGSSFHARGGYQARVNKVFFPKKYEPGNADYDYSLIRLDRPLPIGRNIAVLNLPSRSYIIKDDDLMIVTGWGSTHESGYGNIPDRLRFVPVPLMSMKNCQSSYRFLITPRMICAGYATGGKDACNHDSGGPAVRDGVLLGVVSFGGKKCGDPRNPGVYSRVSEITNWVEDIIVNNEASDDPELLPAINKAKKRERELQSFKARVEFKKDQIKNWLRETLSSSAFIELARKKLLNATLYNQRRNNDNGDADIDEGSFDDTNWSNLVSERIVEEESENDNDKIIHALALHEVLQDTARRTDLSVQNYDD